jgi:hypothetical protein
MPSPSPPFKTILELVLWNGLRSCRYITPDVTNVIKNFSLSLPETDITFCLWIHTNSNFHVECSKFQFFFPPPSDVCQETRYFLAALVVCLFRIFIQHSLDMWILIAVHDSFDALFPFTSLCILTWSTNFYCWMTPALAQTREISQTGELLLLFHNCDGSCSSLWLLTLKNISVSLAFLLAAYP